MPAALGQAASKASARSRTAPSFAAAALRPRRAERAARSAQDERAGRLRARDPVEAAPMLWRAARSLLFRLDPERAHHLALSALRLAGARPLSKAVRPRPPPSLETEAFGLRFEHPLGLAAGFDKGEVVAPGLFALGFSHVEIGTITPRPQRGNPPPRLFRLPEHAAILNRMGFNNDGAEAC